MIKKIFSKLLLFLISLFIISSSIMGFVTVAIHYMPAMLISEKEKDSLPSIFLRLDRIIFLRDNVNAKLALSQSNSLNEIPTALQQAVIAVEDRKFYNHYGFDPEGILRATLVNLQYGEIKEGASTITQQLVKNLFLNQEQSFGRKGEEFLLSLDMELNYSKDEILALYLSNIYFGSGYYGIEDASLGYFAKSPEELNLAECAMLAGIPNAPSIYSPYENFNLAKERQNIVLDSMVAAGFLRQETAELTKKEDLQLAK